MSANNPTINLSPHTMQNILIVDNYDSFTYNLRQLLEEEGAKVTVWRNDRFDVADVVAFDRIVLSPGPGIPDEAGKLKDVIRTWAPYKPILGVCLGEQAIGEVFGATLVNLDHVYHGVQTPATVVAPDYLFSALPETFDVGRYHSWVVRRDSIPACLEVTAVSPDGQVMALRHRQYDVHGIQFHPESVLTPLGRHIISAFLKGKPEGE